MANGNYPNDFSESLSILKKPQQELCKKLYSMGQEHLFKDFPSASPADRRQFASQLENLDNAYPDGGLEGYIKNARQLLDQSRKGVNPLEGWEPSVPEGERFELGTKEYEETEAIGMKGLGSVGFVLVAGGLGERLGYSSIKVGGEL